MTEDAAPSFYALGSQTPLGASQLAGHYENPVDAARPWVAANMIASADGAAMIDGRTAELGGRGDRALFTVLREMADVILVGAGTVRAENYSGAQLSVGARQQRQARGQSEVPQIAVVSGSGGLDPNGLLFTRTEMPPMVFTATQNAHATQERLHGAEVVSGSGSDPALVDTKAVLAELGRRGARRVLCEGGPTLLGDIVAENLLDELALTVAPMLVGGNARRITESWSPVTVRMRVAHVMTDDEGYLYLRYTRAA